MDLVKILKMSETQIIDFVLSKYKDVVMKNDLFIAVIRDASYPFLVSHIDTVYGSGRRLSDKEVVCNSDYIWSPKGIGGDDRAGVYACLYLFEKVHHTNLLLTNYEESGGKGARAFCEDERTKGLSIPYLIEIDRRGCNECVFYNGEDDEEIEFFQIVKRFFEPKIGSYSDVSTIGFHYKVASTNLSAGFFNEHQKEAEYIHIPSLQNTIKKVPELISTLGIKKYEIDVSFSKRYSRYSYWDYHYGLYPYYGDYDLDYEDSIFSEFVSFLVEFGDKYLEPADFDELDDNQIDELYSMDLISREKYIKILEWRYGDEDKDQNESKAKKRANEGEKQRIKRVSYSLVSGKKRKKDN